MQTPALEASRVELEIEAKLTPFGENALPAKVEKGIFEACAEISAAGNWIAENDSGLQSAAAQTYAGAKTAVDDAKALAQEEKYNSALEKLDEAQALLKKAAEEKAELERRIAEEKDKSATIGEAKKSNGAQEDAAAISNSLAGDANGFVFSTIVIARN